MLCHLAAFAPALAVPFGQILGPLVVWMIKRGDSAFVDRHGRESLNFHISFTIYTALASVLLFAPFSAGLAGCGAKRLTPGGGAAFHRFPPLCGGGLWRHRFDRPGLHDNRGHQSGQRGTLHLSVRLPLFAMTPPSHGVLNLLKPPGMTSHDAVAWARRVLKTKRVGHTGTLDPAASGVLPICVGAATRLVGHLQRGTKRYLAEATFGHETDTLDAVGETVRCRDASGLSEPALQRVLEEFRGAIEQQPPMHSAIKVGGRRLYEIAREGGSVEVASRAVVISALHLRRFWPGERPRALLDVECSSGTYIRSLVRDIGRAAGSAATMTFLTRTRNGGFDLSDALTVAEFEAAPRLLSLEQVLRELAGEPHVDDEKALHLWQGKRVTFAPSSSDLVFCCNRERTLFALAAPGETRDEAPLYKAEKVFDLRAS